MSSCTADERTAKGAFIDTIWKRASIILSGRHSSPDPCVVAVLNASVVMHTLDGMGNPALINRPNAAALRPTKLAGSADSRLITQFCMNVYYYLCLNNTIYMARYVLSTKISKTI